MKQTPAKLPPWRLFFPAAALAGIATIVVFAGAYDGSSPAPDGWMLFRWHAHEMLFGHLLAAFAGVLLTSLPRWTGCPPMPTATTLTLFALWLAARLAAFLAPASVWTFASPLFVVALTVVAGRRIVAGRDTRDMPILAVLGLAALADVGLVLDPEGLWDADGRASRLALAAFLGVATVMGGRVAPALTHHLQRVAGREIVVAVPRPIEIATAATTTLALALWSFANAPALLAPVAAVTAVVHLVRLAHWRGWTSWRRPAILALHLGYGCIALGFALIAAAEVRGSLELADAARHAWGVGVFGVLCVAVQTSVARRHGGRPLAADPPAELALLLLVAATVARLVWALAGRGDGVFLATVGLWLAAQVIGALVPLRPIRPRPEATAAPPPPEPASASV